MTTPFIDADEHDTEPYDRLPPGLLSPCRTAFGSVKPPGLCDELRAVPPPIPLDAQPPRLPTVVVRSSFHVAPSLAHHPSLIGEPVAEQQAPSDNSVLAALWFESGQQCDDATQLVDVLSPPRPVRRGRVALLLCAASILGALAVGGYIIADRASADSDHRSQSESR